MRSGLENAGSICCMKLWKVKGCRKKIKVVRENAKKTYFSPIEFLTFCLENNQIMFVTTIFNSYVFYIDGNQQW